MTRPTPLLLALFLTTACAKEAAPPAAAATPQDLRIVATDFGYELPAAPIQAGLTNVVLVNSGQELHHIQLYRLAEGKTLAEFAATQQQEGAPPPAWAVPEGGPNAALPGDSSTSTLILEPGQYVLVCFIPSPDGKSHESKGMILGMAVQPGGNTTAALPAGDLQMELLDYSFAMSQAITAGTHTISVKNGAAQPHEVVVVRVPPGGSMDDWKSWISAGMQGPPPGAPFAGITAIPPGEGQNFTATFTPGTYGLICFVPDAADGQPHLFHGMISTFTVS